MRLRFVLSQIYTTDFLNFAFYIPIRYNRLASGSIPKSLSNCIQLEEFNIENNAVSIIIFYKIVVTLWHFNQISYTYVIDLTFLIGICFA